jgi:hypothetical protein
MALLTSDRDLGRTAQIRKQKGVLTPIQIRGVFVTYLDRDPNQGGFCKMVGLPLTQPRSAGRRPSAGGYWPDGTGSDDTYRRRP